MNSDNITILSVVIFIFIALLFLVKGNIFEKLGHVFIIILCLLAICLFIESRPSQYEIFNIRKKIHPGYYFNNTNVPRPYVMEGGRPYARLLDGSVLNSLGYRDAVPPMPKDKGEFRIIIVGPSSIFLGTPTIPNLIEAEFQRNGQKNVKIYNFSIPASMSSMDLARIVFEVVDYKPDMIVEFAGPAEFEDRLDFDPRPGYPDNFYLYESNPLFKNPDEYPLIPCILFKSKFLRKYFKEYFIKNFIDLDKIRKSVDYGSPSWVLKTAQIFSQNLIKEKKIAHAFGADFIAFYSPTLNMKKHLSRNEIQRAHIDTILKSMFLGVGSNGDRILNELINNDVLVDVSSTRVGLKPDLERSKDLVRKIAGSDFDRIWFILKQTPVVWDRGMSEDHDIVIKEISKDSKDDRVEFVDLSYVFDDVPDTVFFNMLHLNPRGSKIIAGTVYRYLIDHMRSAGPNGSL